MLTDIACFGSSARCAHWSIKCVRGETATTLGGTSISVRNAARKTPASASKLIMNLAPSSRRSILHLRTNRAQADRSAVRPSTGRRPRMGARGARTARVVRWYVWPVRVADVGPKRERGRPGWSKSDRRKKLCRDCELFPRASGKRTARKEPCRTDPRAPSAHSDLTRSSDLPAARPLRLCDSASLFPPVYRMISVFL